MNSIELRQILYSRAVQSKTLHMNCSCYPNHNYSALSGKLRNIAEVIRLAVIPPPVTTTKIKESFTTTSVGHLVESKVRRPCALRDKSNLRVDIGSVSIRKTRRVV